MTIPEWVMIILTGSIISILGWAATRLVKSNDDTTTALNGIVTQISLVNGRLGKAETWQLMHGDDDARRFQSFLEAQKEMWHVINTKRP